MSKIGCQLLTLLVVLALPVGTVCAADAAAGLSPRESQQQALFAQLEKTDAVQEGATEAKSVVYVFFDANCLYCRLTWKALQPYEAVGLQVRWVPVAYQQPSSVGRAAAIMLAADRPAALRKNETGYNAKQFDGGIAPLSKVPPALVAQLQANTQLMQKFGAPGTPALVWQDGQGKIHFKAGLPHLSELPQITRLPAQVIDDPELSAFR